ncbi:MAG: oligopeptide/dipeptide ABC transporter ATP-binding protein [Promethearchaeota archaeon]
MIYPPSGCRFHPRCDERLEVCDKVRPKLIEIGEKHYVACHPRCDERLEVCDKVRPKLIEIGEKHYVACHLFDPKYRDSPKYKWTKKEKEISFKI